jgi:hypothetical protein
MKTKRFELLEQILERWARWYGDAHRPPTGGYRNPLSSLHGEGAELDRASRSSKDAAETMRLVRNSLKSRIAAAIAEEKHDFADSLKRQLQRFPATPSALPWASLIHGSGVRPDPDCPEEERTELAVAALMPTLRRVVHIEFRIYLPQDQKAKQLGYSRSTYQRRLYEAMMELQHRLDP